ncbi:hypothetical protein MKX03_037741, partial [Papaver bracteatum]
MVSEVILGWKCSSVENQVALEWRRYNENILSVRHRFYMTSYIPSWGVHSCYISRCEKVKQVNLKFLTDSNRGVYPNSYVFSRWEGETTNKPLLEIPSSLLLLPYSYGVLVCTIDLVRNDPPWLENNSNFASKHVFLSIISIDLVDRLWVQSPRSFSLVDAEMIKDLPCMDCSSSNEFLLYKMNFDTLTGCNTIKSGYAGISKTKAWVKGTVFVALHDRDHDHGRETSVPSIIIIDSTAGFVSLFSWTMSHHRAGASIFHYMEYPSLGTTEVLDNKVKHQMDLISVPLIEIFRVFKQPCIDIVSYSSLMNVLCENRMKEFVVCLLDDVTTEIFRANVYTPISIIYAFGNFTMIRYIYDTTDTCKGSTFPVYGEALTLDPGCQHECRTKFKKISTLLPPKFMVLKTFPYDHFTGLSIVRKYSSRATLLAHENTMH